MTVDTKARILDVAERLFAEQGFAASSLRDITSEAGVNIAAVNYHFGSKEALLTAILERRVQPVNEERLRRLATIEEAAGTRSPDVEHVLRALLAPPFEKQAEWGAGGRSFLRLMGRLHSETDAAFHARFIAQFSEVFSRFGEALQAALPHLRGEEVNRRMLFLVGSMVYMMMWEESVSLVEQAGPPDITDAVEALVQFGAAGIAAPMPAASSGARR